MSRHDSRHRPCASCGEPCSIYGQQLPVSSSGIVGNVHGEESTLKPACDACFAVHKAAGPVALEAHVKATEILRHQLDETRRKLAKLRDHAQLACDFLNID